MNNRYANVPLYGTVKENSGYIFIRIFRPSEVLCTVPPYSLSKLWCALRRDHGYTKAQGILARYGFMKTDCERYNHD